MEFLKKLVANLFSKSKESKEEKIRREKELILKEKVVTLYDKREKENYKHTEEKINNKEVEKKFTEELKGCEEPYNKNKEVSLVYEGSEAPLEEVDLTKEGSVDWVQFNCEDVSQIERKNIQEALIKEIKIFGDKRSAVATDTKTNYKYTDGKKQIESLENNNTGTIIYGADNGIEFVIPYTDNKEHYLNIYIGSWKSKVIIEGYINDEVIPAVWDSIDYAKCNLENDNQAEHKVFKMKYKLLNPEQNIRFNIYIEDSYEEKYGNLTIQAISVN